MSDPSTAPLLSARTLACLRGDRVLFRALGFDLAAGEALVLIGPNGSGKSTLIRLLAGLSRPDHGQILWQGQEITRDAEAHRARLIYLGHLDAIKPGLSVAEHLELFARLGADPVAPADLARTIATSLERLGIAALARQPGRVLSAGQRRRLALARLLVRPVPLWLLDEPTNALDTAGVGIFRQLAADHLAGGGRIIAATHLDLGFAGARTLAPADFAPNDDDWHEEDEP